MSGTLAGQEQIYTRSRLEFTISVPWGHDYTVPHVLIKRNQSIIRALHVMDSLVQRVSKSVGEQWHWLGKDQIWKGEDLSGSFKKFCLT